MRFVAGRGAVATEILAGAPWWKAIGKMFAGRDAVLAKLLLAWGRH